MLDFTFKIRRQIVDNRNVTVWNDSLRKRAKKQRIVAHLHIVIVSPNHDTRHVTSTTSHSQNHQIIRPSDHQNIRSRHIYLHLVMCLLCIYMYNLGILAIGCPVPLLDWIGSCDWRMFSQFLDRGCLFPCCSGRSCVLFVWWRWFVFGIRYYLLLDIDQVFGNIDVEEPESSITRHNNFRNFIQGLMLLFR